MKRVFSILVLAATAGIGTAGAELPSNQPMHFSWFKPCLELSPQCEPRVLAQGDIQIDSAVAFEAFLANAARPAVSAPWVCFDSPGGSLTGALAIGALIRSKGLDTCMARTYTDVAASPAQPQQLSGEAWCASVCTYALAGGVNRRVAQDAVVAVHQFYSTRSDAGQDLTQRIMTQVGRYLDDMGVKRALLDAATQVSPGELASLSDAQMLTFNLKTAELSTSWRWALNAPSDGVVSSPG